MRDYILVVDDDPTVRLVLTDALEDAGFSVRSALWGPDALQFCCWRAPVVMILGLTTRPHEHITFMRDLDAQRIAPFPVIVVSPQDDLHFREHTRGQFLHVPMELEWLVEKVRGLMPPDC